jgi:hypothetical protein
MKILSLLLAFLSASLLPLRAQVKVEMALEQEHFLVGEKLVVPVKITNRSGQTLKLGAEPDWLTFSVESRDGFVVVKRGESPVVSEFNLESGQVATRWAELTPYFELNRIGRYRVTATVRLKQWDTQLTTKPAAFDIINGAKLWSQDFGVPSSGGESPRPPEVRRYTLEQANYLRAQLRLYLRVTDEANGRILKVFPLGPMVSFGIPEQQIDKQSQLHVFFQNGARSFSYLVVTPDGEIVTRQTHEYAPSSRPRLQLNEEGKVVVAGGTRKIASTDIPEPKPIETNVATPNP